MSTPSTITATLPQHRNHFSHYNQYPQAYHGHDSYVNGSTPRYGNPNPPYAYGASTSDLRRTATASTSRPSQSLQLPPIQTPTSQYASEQYSPEMPQSRGRDRSKRNPDWNEFYKHGVPKEVIVIDDTPEPPETTAAHRSAQTGTRAANNTTRPAEKRRKTGANSAYDAGYQPYPAGSYHDQSSSNNTASTDRTTSALHTTAPTSLGSQASNGVYLPPLEEGIVGQKRKRTTRQTAQVEARDAKRREVEAATANDPYAAYVPPPYPPKKAKDVYVQVRPDKSFQKDQNVDDDDGHYIVVPDADLTDRYQIVKLLGQGTFGKVVEANDRVNGTKCAIKVIRSVQKYRDASRIELRVLSTLAQNDKQNRNKCIHLRDCFDFRKHICIVTDLYGQSVFDFLKSNQFVPFPNSHIQTFARQLLTSVAFLHDLNLIHTDLKPENILLVNNTYQTFTYNRNIPSSSTTTSRTARHRKVLLDPEIRLIDFGSATFDDEYHSSVVSTRHYRAPEIILNLGWSYACDIWSIGCILVEFYTGDALFQTHDNLEHLAMMEAVVGSKIDAEIIRAVTKVERGSQRNSASAYFKGKKLDYPNINTPKASKKYVKAMKKLQVSYLAYGISPSPRTKQELVQQILQENLITDKKLKDIIPANNDFNAQFLDLLRKIFVYNPKNRITAKQALQHPWFQESVKDDGTEASRIKRDKDDKAAREAREAAARGSYH